MTDEHNQVDAQQQFSQTASSQPVNPLEDKERSPASSKGRRRTRRKRKRLNSSMYLLETVEPQTNLLVCWLGYGLLASALVDYAHLIIPPHFTDPVWEFQTIGALADHAAIPLLGLMFVFYRHQGNIVRREKQFLWLLSWLSLLVGVLYLLMLPLGLADTWRIYHANNTQIAAQLSKQSQQLQQIKGKLNQVTTDEQLEQLVASFASQNRSPQIKNPQALKDQFLSQISQAQRELEIQADNERKNRFQTLLKNSLKSNLGVLIAGCLFILIWHLTSWTRNKKYWLKKE